MQLDCSRCVLWAVWGFVQREDMARICCVDCGGMEGELPPPHTTQHITAIQSMGERSYCITGHTVPASNFDWLFREKKNTLHFFITDHLPPPQKKNQPANFKSEPVKCNVMCWISADMRTLHTYTGTTVYYTRIYCMCKVRTIYEYGKMALVVPSASMGQAAIAIRMFTQAPSPTPCTPVSKGVAAATNFAMKS
jgi:hypothetical protein